MLGYAHKNNNSHFASSNKDQSHCFGQSSFFEEIQKHMFGSVVLSTSGQKTNKDSVHQQLIRQELPATEGATKQNLRSSEVTEIDRMGKDDQDHYQSRAESMKYDDNEQNG